MYSTNIGGKKETEDDIRSKKCTASYRPLSGKEFKDSTKEEAFPR
jgi:hypothetical protein